MKNISRRQTLIGITSGSLMASTGLSLAAQPSAEAVGRTYVHLGPWESVIVRGYDHQRGFGFVTPTWPGKDQPEDDYILRLKDVGGERIPLERGHHVWVRHYQSKDLPLPEVVSLAPVVDQLFADILEVVGARTEIPVATIWDDSTQWNEAELRSRPGVERARHMSMYLARWITGHDWWKLTSKSNLLCVDTTPTEITNVIEGTYDIRPETKRLWENVLRAVEEQRANDRKFYALLADLYLRFQTKTFGNRSSLGVYVRLDQTNLRPHAV